MRTAGSDPADQVNPAVDWELEDPADKDLEAVRAIRDDLEHRVSALLDTVAPEP